MVFLLSPLHCTEEIGISMQKNAEEVTLIARRKTIQTFVWISSKNSASGEGLIQIGYAKIWISVHKKEAHSLVGTPWPVSLEKCSCTFCSSPNSLVLLQ
jgi:hypothetical protein